MREFIKKHIAELDVQIVKVEATVQAYIDGLKSLNDRKAECQSLLDKSEGEQTNVNQGPVPTTDGSSQEQSSGGEQPSAS